MEGSYRALTEGAIPHLPGGTEESHESLRIAVSSPRFEPGISRRRVLSFGHSNVDCVLCMFLTAFVALDVSHASPMVRFSYDDAIPQ
jgi:hypothetical protein